MKKLLVIVSLVFVGMAADAQVYMGGSLSINAKSEKNDNGDKLETTFGMSLRPEVGYYLTDRCDIGASIWLGFSGTKYHTTDTKKETTEWRFSPFIRYAFIQVGNFEVIERTNVFVGGTKNDPGSNTFTAGTNIVPILAYNLNEHIALQAELNFVRVGLTYSKTKDGNSTTTANIGFNSDNVANIGGNGITIGFRYKF